MVGVQVVGVCAVLRKFPLCFSVGGEVSTIQVSATTFSTTTVVRIGLACLSVVIRIEPVGIAGIALQNGLSLLLRGEVGAVQAAPTTRTTSTTASIGIGLAGYPVSIHVEVVGIAQVALQFPLGLSLAPKIAAVFIHAGIRRGRRNSPLASR